MSVDAFIHPAAIPPRIPEVDLQDVLAELLGEAEAEEVYLAIKPYIAGEAIAMASIALAKVLAPIQGTVKGAALLHALGIGSEATSLREAARGLGVSPQALSQHAGKYRALLGPSLPVTKPRPKAEGRPPDDGPGWMTVIDASLRLGTSVELMHQLRRAGLIVGEEGRTSAGRRSKQLYLREADVESLLARRLAPSRSGRPVEWRLMLDAAEAPRGKESLMSRDKQRLSDSRRFSPRADPELSVVPLNQGDTNAQCGTRLTPGP